jgi:hypothetical protein
MLRTAFNITPLLKNGAHSTEPAEGRVLPYLVPHSESLLLAEWARAQHGTRRMAAQMRPHEIIHVS